MNRKLRWGILGTGKIAKTFAAGLKAAANGELLAVGSRSQATADAFGAENGAARRYASYEALLADPNVDCVYISMPHTYHVEWSIRAAEAGKHILCEKPMALNQHEAAAVFDAVRRNDVFFMEAFMYRCHPQTHKLAELTRDKVIGEVRVIEANFSFAIPFDPKSRLLDNNLAGGGILDVGCYPVTMCNLIAGAATGKALAEPLEFKALGHLGSTGVDEYTCAVAKYPGEIIARLTTGVQLDQERVVRIYGTGGCITVPTPWKPSMDGASKIVVHKTGEEPVEISIPSPAHLYALEADAVAANIEKRECPWMTWVDSMALLRTMDKWRDEIGLVYNIEKPAKVPVARGGALAVLTAGVPPASLETGRRDACGTGTMKYGTIPGVAKKLSRVIMGMDNQKTMPHLAAVCDDFFERGGNAFDTAYQYSNGLMEGLLGHWFKSRGVREQIVLTGKGAHTPDCFPDRVGNQLAESLERLQTDYVDIYFLHRDNPGVPAGEFIDALNEQVRLGRIRGVFGGSNWALSRIDEGNAYAAKKGLRGFGAVSNNLSLAQALAPVWPGCVSSSDDASRAWFAKTQTPLFAWSSQARGFFTSRVPQGDISDPEVARCWASKENWERKRRAEELAAKRGIPAINIALAYVLNQPFPVFALIGPRTIDETRANAAGVNVELSSDEMKWLNLEM